MSDYSPNLLSPGDEADQREALIDTPVASLASSNSNFEEEYSGNSKLVTFLIAHSGGYIKNEDQANYFGVGAAIFVIIISIIIALSA
ncbi:MAG: hypothetical protein AAB362_01140 [Patescibacteria group bacterium]